MRQILFLRPGTFILFDHVRSTRPELKKTWLLQAMKPPAASGEHLIVTNGKGRLFIQTLLPKRQQTRLVTGADLYTYDGRSYLPERDTGPAPQCRIEVSPVEPKTVDYFLHVLTATDAEIDQVEAATATVTDGQINVMLGGTTVRFTTDRVGGSIERHGQTASLAETIRDER